jgi:hypothetical protein
LGSYRSRRNARRAAGLTEALTLGVQESKEQTVVVSKLFAGKFLTRGSRSILAIVAALWLLAGAGTARAQTWTWTTEDVDKSTTSTAIAADADGNIHLSYGTDGAEWKYAFRPAGTTRWDKTSLAGGAVNYVSLALDSAGNPHLCSTFHRLRYIAFDGAKWSAAQDVAPDSADIQYSCTVGVGPDGKPHLAWYKVEDADKNFYLHLKYASLDNGVWVVRTVDFDKQTGKYHSMAVDAQGVPHLTYDAYVDGRLKYAIRTKDGWDIKVVQSRMINDPEYNVGMGNHLVLDAAGKAHISFYTNTMMRYASEKAGGWDLQTVDTIRSSGGWTSYRSSVVLDKAGNPHIIYQDGGTVKHAFFDGKQWHLQLVVHSGPDGNRFVSAAIDKNDVLFVAYRDSDDGSLKVAVGTPHGEAPQTAAAAKVEKP